MNDPKKLTDIIKEIESEITESKKKCSTSNKWDLPYMHGLLRALEIIKS